VSTTQPSSIGRYEIIRRLGEGGMGAVYLARDPLIERHVAIKFLRDGLENEELRERFIREARSAGRLQHANIVVIFDVGEQSGRPYIAMEYVPGHTIADIVRRRDTMTLQAKVKLLEQLCDGLAYAHRNNIVHRDIKPANVIINEEGVLKILDFGIARLGRAGMTMAGVLLGTLNYMSPEQITGAEVDRRSDIFAVGALCYEFLSYTRAFPGDLQDGILHRIIMQHPPALEKVCPGIDSRIVAVVSKALEKDPAQRYQNLEEMRIELEAARLALGSAKPTTIGPGVPPAAPTPTSGGRAPVTSAPVSGISGSLPKSRTGREQATKFREQQIEHWLTVARGALERGAFDDVFKACQQVFVLDPDNETAVDLSDRAKLSADQRQVNEYVQRATHEMSQGALDEASRYVRMALALDPASDAAIRARIAIDDARQQREQEESRRKAIADGLAEAESAWSQGSFDGVLRWTDQVLALDASQARAMALRDQAHAAIERERKRQEEEARAKAAIDEAQALFDSGSRQSAIGKLDGFSPRLPAVAKALDGLRTRAAELERREEEERQKSARKRDNDATGVVAEARALFSRGDEDAALRLLRGFEPAHSAVTTALAELSAALADREAAADQGATQFIDSAHLSTMGLPPPPESSRFSDEDHTVYAPMPAGSDDDAPTVLGAQPLFIPGVSDETGTVEPIGEKTVLVPALEIAAPTVLGAPAPPLEVLLEQTRQMAPIDVPEPAPTGPSPEELEAARQAEAAERAAREKAAAEQALREKAAADQAAAEKAEQDRLAKARVEQENAEKARLEKERVEKERLAKEKAAAEKAEKDRLAREKADQEKAEKARLEKERLEKERVAKEKAAAEKAEKDRQARERAEKDKAEKDRQAKEKAEKDKAEKERRAREKADKDRADKERAEREKAAKATAKAAVAPAAPGAAPKKPVALYAGIAAAVVIVAVVVGVFLSRGKETPSTATTSPAGLSGQPGSAVLKVTPWAVVESIKKVSDGAEVKPAGDLVTPCVVTLPAGEYSVRVRHADAGQAFDFKVTVEPGKTIEVRQSVPQINLDAELDKILGAGK
jgi:serine/threonine protein kinase